MANIKKSSIFLKGEREEVREQIEQEENERQKMKREEGKDQSM